MVTDTIRQTAQLHYSVHKPPTAKRDKMPAIILLHDLADTDQTMLGHFKDLAPEAYLFALRAPFELLTNQRAWYEVDHNRPDPVINLLQSRQSLDQVRDFVDKLPHRYPIDHRAIYLVGFGQGGNIGHILGLQHPELLAGLVSINSRIPDEYNSPKTVPGAYDHLRLFILHGRMDRLRPVIHAICARNEFLELGARVDYQVYPHGHELPREVVHDVEKWLFARLCERKQRDAGRRA